MAGWEACSHADTVKFQPNGGALPNTHTALGSQPRSCEEHVPISAASPPLSSVCRPSDKYFHSLRYHLYLPSRPALLTLCNLTSDPTTLLKCPGHQWPESAPISPFLPCSLQPWCVNHTLYLEGKKQRREPHLTGSKYAREEIRPALVRRLGPRAGRVTVMLRRCSSLEDGSLGVKVTLPWRQRHCPLNPQCGM